MATWLDDLQTQIDSTTAPRVSPLRRMAGQVVSNEDLTPDLDKEIGAQWDRTRAYAPTLRGFAYQLVGNEAPARQHYADAGALEQQAQREDSDASANPLDWRSVGDAASGLRKLAIQSTPDMALGLLGGGLARGGARRLAAGAERRAIADTVAREAQDATSPLGQRVAAQEARAGATAADEAAAAAQRREAVNRVAAQELNTNDAYTGARKRIDSAGHWAGLAGATVGQYPGQLSGSREYLEANADDPSAAAKIGVADLGASALGSLGEARLLGRAFENPAAQEAIRGSLRQFIPRVAKELAKQGFTEGSTEVLQAAAQRAGHKWVDQNVEMLSPEALNDYAANFLGGAVLGGAMGGSVEAAHQAPRAALDAAGAAGRAGRWAWDATGGARQAVRDRLAGLADRFRPSEPGAPVGAGGPPSPDQPNGPTPTMAERFQQAQDTLSGLARRGADAAASAADRFKNAMQGGDGTQGSLNDELLDEQTDVVMDRLGDMASRPDSGVQVGQTPARLGRTPAQKWMLSSLNQDWLAGQHEGSVRRLSAALEKYTTDRELSGLEHRTLQAALADPASGLDRTQLNLYAAAVPRWMQMSRLDGAPQLARGQLAGLDTENTDSTDDGPETASDAEAAARDAGEDRSADFGGDRELGFFAGERQSDKELPLIDRLNSVRQSLRAVAERGRAADEPQRADKRVEYADLRRQHDELQQQLREDILGPRGLGSDGKTLKNNKLFVMSGGSTPEAQARAKAEFDKRLADPGYVKLTDPVDFKLSKKTDRRPALLDLGTLIRRQQSAIRSEGTSEDNVDPKIALLRGLSEAAQAGLHVDADTLSLGDIKNSKTGELIMKMTPRIRAELRGQIEDFVKEQLKQKQARGYEVPEPQLPSSEDASNRRDADFERATRYEREDSREPTDNEAELYAQGAREAPQGVYDGQRFVPSLGSPVTDVRVDDPYEKQLATWRREREQAGTPRERAAVNRKHGEIIGAADIAHEVDVGTMSPGRAERELSRLKDPNSKLALRYLERAASGELGRVSVTHMKADTAARAKGENADEAYTRAHLGEDKGDGAFERAIAAKRKRVQASTEWDAGPSRRPVKARNPETGRLEMTRRDTRQIARPTGVRQAQEAAKNPGTSRYTLEQSLEIVSSRLRAREDPIDWKSLSKSEKQALAVERGKKQAALRAKVSDARRKQGATVRPASLDDRTENTKEAYERRVDELFDGATPSDEGVRVLDEGDLMTILGFSPAEVRLDEHHTTGSGRRSGKYNHDVPKEVFKQLPEMLDNPVAVFDYPSAGGRDKRFIGVDQQGRAWVIGVNAGGKSRSSGLRSAHVAVTAFGVEETLPVRTMTRDNQLVYLDQKKALTFNRGLPGLKLPDTNGGNARASGSEGYTHQKLPTSVDEARRLSDRTVLTEKRLARYHQQRAEQRAASLPDNAEDAPPPRKRKQVFKTAPKAQAAVDAGATVAPEVSAKAAESIGNAKHDYAAEKSLLKELAKVAGVPFIRSVSGLAEKRGAQVGGKYVSTRDIQVNDNLAGNERMSVLLHEFGHHVVVSKIARALGIDPDAVARMGSDELLAAFDQYRPDVAAEYRAWREKNGERVPVSRSSAPKARIDGALMRSMGKDVARNANFHEWLADNIARALENKREVQSVVGKFFSDIADALRRVYTAIAGDPVLGKYAPAKSVEAWVNDLFDRNVAAVKQATGVSTTAEGADAVVEAAAHEAAQPGGDGLPPEPPAAASGGRWGEGGAAPQRFSALLRYIREVVPPESRAILERGLNTAAARNAVNQFAENVPARIRTLMGDERTSMEARIALGYMMWSAGMLRGESVGLDNLKGWQAWKAGPQTRSAFETIRGDLAKVFGLTSDGALAQRVFEDMASGVLTRRVEAGRAYTPRSRVERTRQQRVIDKATSVANDVGGVVDRVLGGKWERLRDTSVPMLRRIGGLLQKPQGSQSEESGYIASVRNELAKRHARVAAAMAGLSDAQVRHAMSHLQRGTTDFSQTTPEVAKAVEAVRKINRELLGYMRDAGIDIKSRGENYMPVLMQVDTPKREAALRQLLSDPDYAGPIKKLFAAFNKRGEGAEKMTVEQMIDNLVDGAKPSPGNVDPSDNSVLALRAENARSMQFIYDALAKARASGDAAAIEKHEANVRAFARLQTKDPMAYMARYVEPAIKRAEYARRFGAKGEKLEAMLERAKQQGASEGDIALARDAVKAAIGTYGMGTSPTLEAISPALAKRFGGPKTKATVQGLQAYQNLRLLPLSLLSSLVDPMGIAVRSGGDFKSTWQGFKVGMKSIFDHTTREEQRRMLEALGAADDMFAEVALQPGQSAGFAQKVNDTLFRWNGLSAWTRATRYMALNAGHAWLLTHASNPGEASVRYRRELGLRDGDVQTASDGKSVKLLSEAELAEATPAEQARDARVKKALMQFVDEAILRPNAMQSPMWVSDPYMGLVSQYKGFTYAMYDQIYKRIALEVGAGNMRVIAAALMYIPMAAGAELLREFIQTLGDGDPKRKDWGVTEYAMLGAGRTGLFNPKVAVGWDTVSDVKMGSLPGTSQIGPTITQGKNVIRALEGRRDLGKEFESALPASAAWKKWNDAPTANDDNAAAA